MIEFRPVSLADQVYERLEACILNGTYEKGEILSEQRLSKELGVSRTPIREALSRLEYEKLIKETSTGNEVVGISLKDVNDLFEVKKRIEVLATMWCASNIDEDGLKELKDIVEQQEFYAQKEDAVKVRDLDTEFHDCIYNNCGSIVLQGILSPIHHKLMKYRQASLEIEHRIMDSVKEHKRIYESISEGKIGEVEGLILVHIEHAHHCIIEVTERTRTAMEEENKNK